MSHVIPSLTPDVERAFSDLYLEICDHVPWRCRRAAFLMIQQGRSYEEAAVRIRVRVETVRTYLKRFLTLARAAMARPVPPPTLHFDVDAAMKNPDLDVIIDYLTLELTPRQSKELERRLGEDAEFFELAAPIIRFWEVGRDPPPTRWEEIEKRREQSLKARGFRVRPQTSAGDFPEWI